VRVITNQRAVSNRARMVWGLGFGGIFMVLWGGFYLLTGRGIFIAISLIVGGLVIGNIGTYLGRRWLRQPRPEVALKNDLKSLSDRYTLYNYVLPTSHVLLAPHALFVIRPLRHYGKITCEGSHWKHKKIWQRVLLEMDLNRLGNPFRDLKKEISKLRGFLRKHFPEEDVPVTGAIAFINPEAEVTAVDPAFPVAKVDQLGKALEVAQKGGNRINRRQRQKLEKLFDSLK